MSTQCGERQKKRLWRSTRFRASLTLGLVLSLGATGTLAYWTDEGTITGGTFSSGSLDLTAGDTVANSANNLAGLGPNTWTYTAFTLSTMVPGESISALVVVRNTGSVPFVFNGTVTSTTNDMVAAPTTAGLLFEVFDESTAASQTGTQAGGNRAGVCTGGTQVYSHNISTTSTTPKIFTTAPTLATNGATRTLCVRATLPTTAPNALQGKSTSVSLNLSAAQVGQTP